VARYRAPSPAKALARDSQQVRPPGRMPRFCGIQRFGGRPEGFFAALGDRVSHNRPGPGLAARHAAAHSVLTDSEEEIPMQAALKTVLFVTTLALAGCATTGDFEKLESRVSSLESKLQAQATQMEALQFEIKAIDAKADRSVAQAAEAAARAEEAARKADAIFKKSVSK
jgi:murein lipoprotein